MSRKIKKRIKRLFVISAIFLLFLAPCPVKAEGSLLPTPSDNLDVSLISKSTLVSTDNGYTRIFYDGNLISLENYDNEFNLQDKKALPLELPLWGGFYAGSDAYYLVEGQNNTAEDDTAEIIRVIKYDLNWNRLGFASVTGNPELFGGEVRYPFHAGCVEMTEHNGILYIVTGHEGYVDDAVGQGHQGFLMIEVDEQTMTGKIVDCDLWHSFAQYITSRDSSLYVLEQSEGSRYTKLSRYDLENKTKDSFSVLDYGGNRDSVWAIPCYASVDDMALSASNVLCLGTSIDQSLYDTYDSDDTSYNIYLTVTPISNFTKESTTVKWLTDYNGGGKSFLGTKITKINDDRFMVSWEEYGSKGEASEDDILSVSTLHYVFINGNGDKISGEYTERISLSDCQPVVKDSKVVYYASNDSSVDFYSIDAQTGAASKKVYRMAGENATWDIKDGVLTVSGTGMLFTDTEGNPRYPVSPDSMDFPNNNTWRAVKDRVKKIVISEGITGISDNSFPYFDHLEEVEIKPGLTTIGAQAFYGCESLSKIIIPSTVTNIGQDFLWTGYYWTYDGSHVTQAAVYAPYDSYAINYAKKNNIDYMIDLSVAEVSGINESYEYTGKEIEPEVTVKLGEQTLEEDSDYYVNYADNIKEGTAKITIVGTYHYYGSIEKEFMIVPAKKLPEKENTSDKNTGKVSLAKGSIFKESKSGAYYQVTKKGKTNKATAAYIKPVSKKKTVTIPAAVTFKGITYKVTSVAARALFGNTKVTKLTIGKNVSSIGVQAFFGCKNLKSITINTDSLIASGIGAESFKGISSKAVIKVPAENLTLYKNALKTKGIGSRVKIIK